jgi:signal transduction histidine kinase
MLMNMFGVFALLTVSTGYIYYSTVRMQEVVTRSFDEQWGMKDMQAALEEFQKPLLDYLSRKSSSALSELLILGQRIRGMIPAYRSVPSDEIRLREMETYRMVESYLELADRVVAEKRGTDISGYTAVYDEMRRLFAVIGTETAAIANARFSDQLDDYERFISVSRNIQLWNLLFILFVSIFSALLISHAAERINKPMVHLSGMATEISAGHFDIDDVRPANLDEIDHVVDAFNRMKRDIRSYIEELRWQRQVEQEYLQERVRNMRMEQMIKRMELYTLQAQMNPHFLFNTLNTGVQLAIVEGADRTGEYMEHLAALFRHNLRDNEVVVPLRHEIEGLESFFYILGVRFPKNLDLVLDCPEDLLDSCRVPSSILQPLVENSIVHAFRETQERKLIAVRASRDGSLLCLSVADNGAGMDADTVARLLAPQGQEDAASKITGLENVIHRLRFFYPDDPSVILIDSSPGKGTEIRMTIDTEKELCTVY